MIKLHMKKNPILDVGLLDFLFTVRLEERMGSQTIIECPLRLLLTPRTEATFTDRRYAQAERTQWARLKDSIFQATNPRPYTSNWQATTIKKKLEEKDKAREEEKTKRRKIGDNHRNILCDHN